MNYESIMDTIFWTYPDSYYDVKDIEQRLKLESLIIEK